MVNIILSNTLPPSIITTNITQYEMPDETLHWQPPVCIICKERKYCYVALPYGSDYDGDIICGDCCHKYLDPVIAVCIQTKEAKNAPDSQD